MLDIIIEMHIEYKYESILTFPSIRAASQHLARYNDTGVVRIQVY